MCPRRTELDFRIEPLSSLHERSSFASGVWALDQYLHRQAGQERRKDVAAVFVATPDGVSVAGFYTLSAHAVKPEAFPSGMAKKMPYYDLLPTTLLGRLAVSNSYRGQGVGELLLYHALEIAESANVRVASTGVVVDAKDEGAKGFYLRYGFIELPLNPMRLFLPMKTIQAMIQKG